mmetsp:Transcript_15199/g.23441  ORF Transcript_15199/g.23441 Transcript_15199/m.23441 type:complete len:82 (+) Transcript_15199:387-632(+)
MYFAISSTLAADGAVDLIALSLGRRSSENISNNTTAIRPRRTRVTNMFFFIQSRMLSRDSVVMHLMHSEQEMMILLQDVTT